MNMNIGSIEEDKSFQKYLSKKSISERTLKTYKVSLLYFCQANGKTFHQIVKSIRKEQRDVIENGIIIRYDPNYGLVDDYITAFVDELRSKGNTNTSIDHHLRNVKGILSALGVKLPDMPTLDDDAADWYLLSKEEIRYMISICNLHYQFMITFLACTGMRLSDALSLTIGDFMKATGEYHDITEVDEFLDKAPQDMIGFWDFYPQKTKKRKIPCKVCNTPEASNLGLLYLRQRRDSINKMNEKNGTDLALAKSDALFGSRIKNYKGFISPSSISSRLAIKNKTLIEDRKRILKSKLDDGEISEETYDELLSQTPKFHAHGLRKFFISTISSHVGDIRICALMEGHSSPLPTDKSYIKISDELVREAYFKVIPELSFENVEVDFLTSKEKVSLQEEVVRLREENRNMRHKMESYVDKAVDQKVQEKIEGWLNG